VDLNLYNFCNKLYITKERNSSTALVAPFEQKKFTNSEKHMLRLKFNIIIDIEKDEKIEAARAKINNKIFHSLKYSRTGKTNSYTICYTDYNTNVKTYGKIRYFFQHKLKIYAALDKIQIDSNLNNILGDIDDLFRKYVNITNFKKYFQMLSSIQHGTRDIILVESILYKSIIINSSSNLFITNINALSMHS